MKLQLAKFHCAHNYLAQNNPATYPTGQNRKTAEISMFVIKMNDNKIKKNILV